MGDPYTCIVNGCENDSEGFFCDDCRAEQVEGEESFKLFKNVSSVVGLYLS